MFIILNIKKISVQVHFWTHLSQILIILKKFFLGPQTHFCFFLGGFKNVFAPKFLFINKCNLINCK